ncbi:CD1247 N-terminal domain-containing protein [Anaerotignum sp.]|uniref:CD1247 N-terminal domain-containing protein n=1 Tax=Anaerotignum sp. TaxID=2039241 RepID=UPI0028AA55FA|nr:CD1247 N-terminal domain-containing protein [Anaerotignum sp.]
MEYFEKKITYLRGMCDGSGFDEDSKEGKVFHGILDILDDMAFMLETFMDDEDMECMDDCDCEDGESEPIFFYSFICPNCGEEIDVDEETMETETEIQCPKCGNGIPMGTADVDKLKF